MFNRDHDIADPNYINIGDSDLIAKRHEYPVGINPPGGALGEYVPFYFGRLSPMLLNIKTGYRGIRQRTQSDIVYIICKVDDIIANCDEWCFTDGHAKTRITEFYNDLDDLGQVYWDKVDLKYWSSTEDDLDRMRHKQAEFLVRSHVPVQCIAAIVTYNNNVAENVKHSVGVEHVLHALNGKYIKGLEQMNAKAFEPLELQYDKLPELKDFVQKQFSAEQRARLSNLVKLIDGFESALSLEILSTVDFVKRKNPGIDRDGIVDKIYNWSDRKRKLFQPKYIDIAAGHLFDYSN